MKIGVLTPTYNRPDFARFLALQMENQELRPNILCIHQNGQSDSYEWSVMDVQRNFDLHWIHTPTRIPQDEWYAIPLEYLINQGVTHYFWCDHDDIYHREHIVNGVDILNGGKGQDYDFSVNEFAGLLLLNETYGYEPVTKFNAHAPGGMSSSMCFNRLFAIELLKDIRKNTGENRNGYTDQIVGLITKQKFRCYLNPSKPPTTTYVCHSATVSSRNWLNKEP